MKNLIMLMTIALMLTACGTKDEKPTAADAQKGISSKVEDAKKAADKAAADAKKEGEKASKDAGAALKKIGG